MEKDVNTTDKNSTIEGLNEVTRVPRRWLEAFQVIGILIREDNDAIYVADPQGTWVITREDVLFMEDSQVQHVPEDMRSMGKPVRIGIKDGSIIQEIRPWQIKKGAGALGGAEFRQAIEKIFTLGGAPLPVGERTMLGESQLSELERMFARRVGWNPDDPSTQPRAIHASASHTIHMFDGYCDVDCPF